MLRSQPAGQAAEQTPGGRARRRAPRWGPNKTPPGFHRQRSPFRAQSGGAGETHPGTCGTKQTVEDRHNSDISSHGYTLVFEFVREVESEVKNNLYPGGRYWSLKNSVEGDLGEDKR